VDRSRRWAPRGRPSRRREGPALPWPSVSSTPDPRRHGASRRARPAKGTSLAPEPRPTEPGAARSTLAAIAQAGERRRAKELIARLEAIGIAHAEEVTRSEIVDDESVLARLAIERRLHDTVKSDRKAKKRLRATLETILEGKNDELGVE
jgi:hypothetical protein